MFRQRAGRLPEAARTALLVAAADTTGEVPAVLRAVAGLGLPLDALDPAEDAGLIRVAGQAIIFRHPLVRSALYQVAVLDFDFAAPGRPVYDLARFALLCVPVDDEINAARLGWHPADKASRLRLAADSYGLGDSERRQLVEVLDGMIARSGQFVRRRVEAGDPNFIKMWNEMGGTERFDRRRRWWSAQRQKFVTALR